MAISPKDQILMDVQRGAGLQKAKPGAPAGQAGGELPPLGIPNAFPGGGTVPQLPSSGDRPISKPSSADSRLSAAPLSSGPIAGAAPTSNLNLGIPNPAPTSSGTPWKPTTDGGTSTIAPPPQAGTTAGGAPTSNLNPPPTSGTPWNPTTDGEGENTLPRPPQGGTTSGGAPTSNMNPEPPQDVSGATEQPEPTEDTSPANQGGDQGANPNGGNAGQENPAGDTAVPDYANATQNPGAWDAYKSEMQNMFSNMMQQNQQNMQQALAGSRADEANLARRNQEIAALRGSAFGGTSAAGSAQAALEGQRMRGDIAGQFGQQAMNVMGQQADQTGQMYGQKFEQDYDWVRGGRQQDFTAGENALNRDFNMDVINTNNAYDWVRGGRNIAADVYGQDQDRQHDDDQFYDWLLLGDADNPPL